MNYIHYDYFLRLDTYIWLFSVLGPGPQTTNSTGGGWVLLDGRYYLTDIDKRRSKQQAVTVRQTSIKLVMYNNC